ncbi:MAG: polymerase subunit gamma/tau [Candidatus Petromonas sp.]|nr:polymerase subunit gamma/tau [Candidatus Petromonas sp.]
MAYTALYRKWRPKVFEEVVGQRHITMTLKNQIKSDNIAHAYLFCGTRGTGKTSTAKIFARAINCLAPQDYNPCNQCEVCEGIINESIMDVVEIDAASNNGVDNIRELRENVKYPPSKSRYKVYIIDEVHMLSQGAFNALLKTLEEPPDYVIFILATTEPHKIPSTIHSRCQRFDFKRVGYDDIFIRLKYICKEMEIEVEDSALRLIIRNSDGAVRDALSILDQCISFSDGRLTYDKAVETLGLVTDEFLFSLTDAIYKEDSKTAMKLIDELISSGKDINQFVKDFINHFRNLMMTKMAQNLEDIIDTSIENIKRLKKQGENFEINTIIRAINILSQTESEIKWSSQPRVLLELAIVKMIRPRLDDSYEGLLDRIGKLEKKLENLKHEDFKTNTPVQREKTKFEEKKLEQTKTEETNELIKEDRNDSIEKRPAKTEAKYQSNLDFNQIKNKWNQILNEVKKRKVAAHAVLMEGQPVTIEENRLIISFGDRFWFHKDATSKKNNSELIEQTIYEITGQKVRLRCVMEDEIEDFDRDEDKMAASSQIEEEIKAVKEFFSDFEDKLEILE